MPFPLVKACVAGEAMRGGVASRTNAVGGNKAPANADTGARDSGSGVMGRGGTVRTWSEYRRSAEYGLVVVRIRLDRSNAMFVES